MHELKNKTAVITGGARGIGLAIAKKLGAMGANIGILDLERKQIEQGLSALREAGVSAAGEVCDVSDEASVGAAFKAIRARLGPITLLVNNAGVIDFKGLEETTADDYRKTMDINALGVFLCTKAALADMKEARWGKIVTIGSSAGKNGGAGKAGVYGASKAAAMTLAKSFARELAPYHINVNAVAPALINTQMLSGITQFVDKIPLGRVGEPEDVAAAVGFLCSEAASFITGEMLDINGGFLID